ncbi:MAG: hypothetical protein K0R10_2025, partial [Alphaproteobacteria bacterium]|nr:hypothetical protein [Alphaproteobacteria bacterium]
MGALLEALAEILFFGTTYSGTRSSEPAVTLAAVFIVACILGMISMVVVPDAVIETMALRWIVLAMAPFF